MKTIERYVFCSFLTSFLLAFLVFSFVLTIGLLVKIVGLILDGVSATLIGNFAAVSFPETLQWTIPLSLMVSSMLVFSRLSADSEVAAMRACGVNLLSVMRWPILFGFVCTLLACWVNNEIVPRGHEVRRNLKQKASVGQGLEVLEPGVWITDFPKVKIYFASREGRWLYDLTVMDYSNPKIERQIHASKALVTEEGRDISLEFYQMTVEPLDEKHPGLAHVARYRYVVKEALENSSYTRKVKDLRFFELLQTIDKKSAEVAALRAAKGSAPVAEKGRSLYAIQRGELSRTKVELSKRFALALASICFVLVGAPLGIRSHRRESTIGMAISLVIGLGYYLVVLLMQNLQKVAAIHPEWLIFLPALVVLALSVFFIRKNL